MSSRSPSPMEQGEIEASPDLHGSPGIILDPDDEYSNRQMTRGPEKDKPSKIKHDSRSPERHDDLEDVLNIQPPQIACLKKDKHRHHRHGKGDGHKRATREADKYLTDSRHSRDERQTRKYEDKSRAKHAKRESEMSSSLREFAKQQDREVEVLRRQKSLQERERLERLERERYRIEKERQMKEREYWAKMKKSEQEQAARNEQERRQQRVERPWRDDERERQNSDEMMKRRGKDVSKKGGRQRSRTRSRSPLLRAPKESEKDVRRIASDHRRDEAREVRRHESWFKDKRGSDQDRERDHDHDRVQEQYLRNKLYSSMNKDSISSHEEDHPEPRDDVSVASDRSESEEREQVAQEARHSSASHDESEKSHESNASQRSRSERSQSGRSREEEDEEENEENHRLSTHEDMLRSKFDDDEDDRQSESGDRGSRNSLSSGAEDDENDAVYMEDSPIHSSPEMQPQLPPYFPALQGCRNVEEFQCLNRIEEGTYGVVYRAIDLKKEEVVALKRLKMEKEKEGFPITSLREINTLLKAQHPNIVTVREIVVGSNMDKIYIVMDYVEHDLKSLMEYMKEPFSVGEVKTLLLQLLRGVAHLHDNWIIHRDLKTSNLLLSHKGILKIGDFGLAREYGSPLRPYTPIVVTLWYRTPELLLGAKEYSTPIDLWSVGCIFAEFLTRKPLFPGKSEIDQLNRIFKDLGTPNEKIWPGVSELPAMKKCTFTEYPFNQLQSKFKLLLTGKGLDLLNRFLTYNPEKRVNAEDAKRHEFFAESPLPVDPSMFPTWPAKSEQSKSRTHGNSPKPPSGGKAYAKLLGDDEEYGARFHLGGPTTIGDSAKATGFALKF